MNSNPNDQSDELAESFVPTAGWWSAVYGEVAAELAEAESDVVEVVDDDVVEIVDDVKEQGNIIEIWLNEGEAAVSQQTFEMGHIFEIWLAEKSGQWNAQAAAYFDEYSETYLAVFTAVLEGLFGAEGLTVRGTTEGVLLVLNASNEVVAAADTGVDTLVDAGFKTLLAPTQLLLLGLQPILELAIDYAGKSLMTALFEEE